MRHLLLAGWLTTAVACGSPEAPPPDGTSSAPDTTTITTNDRIASIQDRLRADGASETGPDAPAPPNPYADWVGRTETDVRAEFGRPVASATQGRKSLLVYRVGTEDATALYLFLADDQVSELKLDEFNGLAGSSALDWLHF
jgi:hypothetical protein